MDEAKLIDKRDVSKEYGIPVSTQEVLTAKGDFCPHLCVGKKWYYRRAELEAWLNAQQVVTTPSAREVVEAPAHDGDEFWGLGQQGQARGAAAGGETS